MMATGSPPSTYCGSQIHMPLPDGIHGAGGGAGAVVGGGGAVVVGAAVVVVVAATRGFPRACVVV
jgi:hypothetical protein